MGLGRHSVSRVPVFVAFILLDLLIDLLTDFVFCVHRLPVDPVRSHPHVAIFCTFRSWPIKKLAPRLWQQLTLQGQSAWLFDVSKLVCLSQVVGLCSVFVA